MRLFLSKPGEICKERMWVFIESYYIYTSPTLISLIILVIKEWRNDRHLVG
jgi:hypothetical protein